MAWISGQPETKIWRAAEEAMRAGDRTTSRRETLAAAPDAMMGAAMLALRTIWGEFTLRSFQRGIEASDALGRNPSLADALQAQAEIWSDGFDDLLACQARSAAVGRESLR
jgi:hypothetical protein